MVMQVIAKEIVSHFDVAVPGKKPRNRTPSGLFLGVLIVLLAGGVAGCSKDSKKPGQAVVKVNGEEITTSQLNSELQLADVPAEQQAAARTQLLESLIDRQLLQDAAARDKMDRTPEVMQAVERAKGIIIAQSYMQKHLQMVGRPSKAEVEAYFYKNSDRFLHRQQFDLRQLVFAQPNSAEIVEKVVKSANTIEEATAWLNANSVQFARNEVSRTTTDLSPELAEKLKAMPVGRLFVVNQDGHAALAAVSAVKDVPVDLQVAAPQIEQFLAKSKNRDAAAAELARLRKNAKIEYLNGAAGGPTKAAPLDATGKSPAVERADAGDNTDVKQQTPASVPGA